MASLISLDVISLDVIDVASPCTASWDAMAGDDHVRHCGQCRLNVYNLSEMGRDDALKLVQEREGRLCVRFLRRADGTVITRDCPIGLRALRRRLTRAIAAVAALVAFVLAGGVWAKTANRSGAATAGGGPLNRLVQWLEPPPPTIQVGQPLMVMGDIALPLPPNPMPPNPLPPNPAGASAPQAVGGAPPDVQLPLQ